MEEHFNFYHIHTTPEGRHFRHGDGVEVDGEGNPIVADEAVECWTEESEPDRRNTVRDVSSDSVVRTRTDSSGRRRGKKDAS